jgi:alpha-beta hydrolase superfamily lysophospholipase
MSCLTENAIHSLEATVNLAYKDAPYHLTGLKSRRLPDGDFGKTLVYVAGLGGSFQWASPFWKSLIEDGTLDAVIGIDLPSFGVNHHLKAGKLAACIEDLKTLCELETLKTALSIHTMDTCFFSGISLGAVSSLYVLPHVQADYEGIILFVPAFKGCQETYTPTYVASALWQSLKQTLRKNLDAPLTLPYTMDAITQCPQARQHYKDAHASDAIQHPLGFMTSILPWQLKASKQMKTLEKPVLMITAGQDFICETAAMHKAFKQLTPHHYNKLAHFPMLYHDVLLEPDRDVLKEPLRLWLKTFTDQ